MISAGFHFPLTMHSRRHLINHFAATLCLTLLQPALVGNGNSNEEFPKLESVCNRCNFFLH